jgi:demethylmacrocin O-methyltransferase
MTSYNFDATFSGIPTKEDMSLTGLGKKYGTDKAARHRYTDVVYGPIFGPHRDAPIHILEIGAGKVGGSHKMWKKYFSKGEVYCMDPFFLPDQEVTIEEMNEWGIHVIQGNQLNRDDLHRAGKRAPVEGYDFIVDDAAHMPDAIQLSLATLFPYLKSGGVYIVEDLATARRRGGNQTSVDSTNANLDLLDSKGLMNERHHVEYTLSDAFGSLGDSGTWLADLLTDDEKSYLEENIASWEFIAISSGVVVIKKK